MATLNYDQVWEAVRALPPEELRRLRNLVDTLLAYPGLQADHDHLNKEQRVLLSMLQEGSISRIPPPPTTTRPRSVWNTSEESVFVVSRPSSAASAWAT